VISAPFKVAAIAAMDEGRVIGNSGRLPWHLPGDMKHFQTLTAGHTVMMGRKTYESLPERFRPLPGRLNVVVTRRPHAFTKEQGVVLCTDPGIFIEKLRDGREKMLGDILWVIGGEEIYRSTLSAWEEVRLTLVKGRFTGDAFFPEFESRFRCVACEEHEEFSYLHYLRASEEG
jgi:dihydrofolate reductase